MNRSLSSTMIQIIDNELATKGSYFTKLWIGLKYQQLERPNVYVEAIGLKPSILDMETDDRDCLISLPIKN